MPNRHYEESDTARHVDTAISAVPSSPGGKWPGVVLSLIVPGCGLVRAGMPARGVTWFLGLTILDLLLCGLLIFGSIPLWVIIAGVAMLALGKLIMLADSFRPGRFDFRTRWMFGLGLAYLLCVACTVPLTCRHFKIPSGVMEPTLHGAAQGNPDHFIVNRLSYFLSPPRRGDIVVFRTDGIRGLKPGSKFVQRIIGMPGEHLEIRNGRVFANGCQLGLGDGIPDVNYQLPDPSNPPPRFTILTGPLDVPQGSYFVLGDHTANSVDSRYWGCLPQANLYGRITRIIYPFSRSRKF